MNTTISAHSSPRAAHKEPNNKKIFCISTGFNSLLLILVTFLFDVGLGDIFVVNHAATLCS